MVDRARPRQLALRTLKWIAVVLAIVLTWSLGDYYVRELFSALLLSAVLFVTVAVLLTLFMLLEELLDWCAVRCCVSANRVPAEVLARLRSLHS